MNNLENIVKMLDKFGAETIAKILVILKNGGKGDSNFIRLLKYSVEQEDELIRVSLYLPDYWEFIEYGRGPNKKMPPSAPIKDWMKRKSILEKYEYPIRRKIGIRGIKPLPFIDIWYERISSLNDRISETASKDLEKMVSEYIKNNI